MFDRKSVVCTALLLVACEEPAEAPPEDVEALHSPGDRDGRPVHGWTCSRAEASKG